MPLDLANGSQEACRSWRRGKKKTKPPSLAMNECFRDGVRSCFWAAGLTNGSPTSGGMILEVLAVGFKMTKTPSLVVETCLSASETPHRSKSIDCIVLTAAW